MNSGSRLVCSAAVPEQDTPVLTSTSWNAGDKLDLREWLRYGRRLGTLGRSVNWWIGDWLRYGNARYGERYARAARATGYDAQSLMNMVYVASRFAPSRRREGLSWSHHAELAALDEAEQDRWLALAETHQLSVHSLRLELRALRKAVRQQAAVPPGSGEPSQQDPAQIVCPKCRHVITEAKADAAPRDS